MYINELRLTNGKKIAPAEPEEVIKKESMKKELAINTALPTS